MEDKVYVSLDESIIKNTLEDVDNALRLMSCLYSGASEARKKAYTSISNFIDEIEKSKSLAKIPGYQKSAEENPPPGVGGGLSSYLTLLCSALHVDMIRCTESERAFYSSNNFKRALLLPTKLFNFLNDNAEHIILMYTFCSVTNKKDFPIYIHGLEGITLDDAIKLASYFKFPE